MAEQESELDRIKGQLNSMDIRLRRLEAAMAYSGIKAAPVTGEQKPAGQSENISDSHEQEDKGLESQIGRFGLAWMGNIVLLFGITFLTQYLMNLGHHAAAAVLGYIAAGSIFLVSGYLKKTNQHLSFMFKLNAQAILFYVTMRLHFFTPQPLVAGKGLSVFLLLVIVGVQVYLAIREKSQAFAAMAVLLSLTTAVLSDATIFIIPLLTITAAGSVYYFRKFSWKALLVMSIILTYSSLLIWMLGDPFMGHPVKLIAEKYMSVMALFSLGAIYSIVLIFREKDSSDDDYLIGITLLNGILFTLSLLFVVMSYFSTGYMTLFAGITVCCLLYSTILHSRSSWNFASAFYALYGFMAMSISLYGLVGFPRIYLLLSAQSLLVVSMALWFRNKLIVLMNSMLFLVILAVYMLTSQPVDGVNFSFAIAALLTARLINWQNNRLKIETDLIRNLYMIEGFVMVLFALIHAVPKQFVTLSWTMAALLYFLLSIVLKNVKYRYMALGTMICAAFYLFIVDLARIDLVYRILALLFLAAISIGISIYYSNRIKRTEK
jgi:hypothetical protein